MPLLGFLVALCFFEAGASSLPRAYFGKFRSSGRCLQHTRYEPRLQARRLREMLRRYNCSVEALVAETQAARNNAVFSVSGFPRVGLGFQFNCGFSMAVLGAAAMGRRLVYSEEEWSYGCVGHPRISDVFRNAPPAPSQLLPCTPSVNLSQTYCMEPFPSALRCGSVMLTRFQLEAAGARHVFSAGLREPLAGAVAADVAHLQAHLPVSFNAIHIRSGDKVLTEGKELAHRVTNPRWWAQWVAANDPRRRPVFLSTDNCTMANLTQRALRTFHIQSVSRCSHGRLYPGEGTGFFATTFMKSRSCLRLPGLFTDLHLLVHADVFFGSMLSNIGRLVVTLRGTLNHSVAVPGTAMHSIQRGALGFRVQL